MTKHSKGPWVLDDLYPGNVYSDDSTGSIVAMCSGFTHVARMAGEVAANAKLIAAAPELLASAEELDACVTLLAEKFNVPDVCPTVTDLCGNVACEQLGCLTQKRDRARAAIAKATA